MCRNGRYTERGIKERHGYGAERFRIEPEFAVKIDPIWASWRAARACQHPRQGLGPRRTHRPRARVWQPQTLLVTGAGPIGLLAALMGTCSAGSRCTCSIATKAARKEAIVRDLGGIYHSDSEKPRAARARRVDGMHRAPADLWLSRGGGRGRHRLPDRRHRAGKRFEVDIGGLNRTLVLDNSVVFGTVNANRRHYEMAAQALARADKSWLERLITRRVPLERWSEALEHRRGDIKVIIDF